MKDQHHTMDVKGLCYGTPGTVRHAGFFFLMLRHGERKLRIITNISLVFSTVEVLLQTTEINICIAVVDHGQTTSAANVQHQSRPLFQDMFAM